MEIVISELRTLHSKAKLTAPAYSRALRLIKDVVHTQGLVTMTSSAVARGLEGLFKAVTCRLGRELEGGDLLIPGLGILK